MARPASATFVSTVGPGGPGGPGGLPAPLTLAGPSTSVGLDLNGDGTTDITFGSAMGTALFVQVGANSVSYSGFCVTPYPSLADFQSPRAGVFTSGTAPIMSFVASNLSSDWPYAPGQLEVLFTAVGSAEFGYVKANAVTDTRNNTASITILDDGYQAPIPAPPAAILFAKALTVFSVCMRVHPGSRVAHSPELASTMRDRG